MIHGSVVHDPTGSWDTKAPLDRDAHTALATAVLHWDQHTAPAPADVEQTALLLSGYLDRLARELHTALETLPHRQLPVRDHVAAEIALSQVRRRLDGPSGAFQGEPLAQAQSAARLVDTLHHAVDRTLGAHPPTAT
ncbi:hypothetical protein ACIRQY_34005 [Streptomyces sp. NPDC101490]|uniref:hypothetical protein n=1 Tax=Streptomyces sp. NPDC101490 TaxID=3366143 RepID=UPI0037F5FBD2